MTDTSNLTLPLLAAAQAQKHVTVNEALQRLDGVVQLTLRSRSEATPPGAVLEGECFGVPGGAVNAWAGRDGEVAQYVNGGWVFFTPKAGWRAFVADRGTTDLHDGSGWRAGAVSAAPGGAGMQVMTVEQDVAITAGGSVTAALSFPARSIVFGVTGRVTDAITGTLADWRLGDTSSDDRFGSGLGTAQNSWISGPVNPFVVWAPTPLLLTANGGDFAGGTVRLALHYAAFTIPDAV